jgi:hypothetical protein
MEQIRNLTIEEYHNGEGISASKLKKALQSTAHFFAKDEPSAENEAFLMGQAFEDLLTEPESFDNKYFVLNLEERPEADKTMASKANKAWKEEILEANKTKKLLNIEQKDVLNEMVKSCSKNKTITSTLNDATFQGSYFWKDEETGLLCKTRPDIIKYRNENSVIINDIKTAQDASPEAFAKNFANFGYGIQAAMQIDGVASALGVSVEYYTYTVVEKKAPYLAQVYTLAPEDIDYYRAVYKTLLKRVKEAMEDGERIYYGYAEDCGNKMGILELEIPQWHINQLSNKLGL